MRPYSQDCYLNAGITSWCVKSPNLLLAVLGRLAAGRANIPDCDVSSASVGIAFLATICREGSHSMVLATMRALKLKEEARKEGRKQQRRRYEAALAKYGVEVDGVLMLPQTPEVREFLEGEPGEE